MKVLCTGYAVLYIGTLLAVLSEDAIVDALGWTRDGYTIRRSGPLDLRMGGIVMASGFINGARFYPPELQTSCKLKKVGSYTIKFGRKYNEDYTLNRDTYRDWVLPPDRTLDIDEYRRRYHQVLACMFPSPSGELNIRSGTLNSFTKTLETHPVLKENIPQIFASLMAMALGAKLETDPPCPTKKTLKTKSWGSNIVYIKYGDVVNISYGSRSQPDLLRIVRFFQNGPAEYNCSDPSSEAFLLSKEVLLHAFMHEFFNSPAQLNQFTNTFFEIVKSNGSIFDECFARVDESGSRDGEKEAGLYQNFLGKSRLQIKRSIPFTPFFEPFLTMQLPYYNCSLGTFTPDTDTFSDCVEATLLSFFYCIFFDPEAEKCNLDECCEEVRKTDLAKFFKKYPRPVKSDKEMRTEWLRVIGDLGRDIWGNESKHSPGYRGNICPGLLNLLRIVVRAAGLSQDEYLPQHARYGQHPGRSEEIRLRKVFMEKFMAVVSKVCPRKVDVSYPQELKMLEIGYNEIWDLTGPVELRLDRGSQNEAIFVMEQQDAHASISIQRCFAGIPEDVEERLHGCVKSFPGQSSNRQMRFALHALEYFLYLAPTKTNISEDSIRGLIEASDYSKLYATVPLRTLEQKTLVLKAIFPQFVLVDNPTVLRLADNILTTLALERVEVVGSIHPAIAFNWQFRKNYGILLEDFSSRTADGVSSTQCNWLSTDELRIFCFTEFACTPEWISYFNEKIVAEMLMRRAADDTLYHAVGAMPSARRYLIYSCGFILAGMQQDEAHARHFFRSMLYLDDLGSNVRMDSATELDAHENISFSLGFFEDLLEAEPSEEVAGLICDWSFRINTLPRYLPRLNTLIRRVHVLVGREFASERLNYLRHRTALLRLPLQSIDFFFNFLTWMNSQGIERTPLIENVIRDYMNDMSRLASDTKLHPCFENMTYAELKEFRDRLYSFEELVEESLPVENEPTYEIVYSDNEEDLPAENEPTYEIVYSDDEE